MWKYNKNKNWDNVFLTDESSFYLKCHDINKWISPNHNNYEREKIYEKIQVWEAFWSRKNSQTIFLGNMDSKKYIDILKILLTK